MARISRDITINASPDRVFEYVSDMPRHSEWAQHDLSVSQTSSGPVGVGATFASTGHQFGVQHETQTVVDYTPGRRFAFDAKGSIGTVRHAFDIEAAGDGSQVTKSMEIVKASMMARLMGPIIRSKTKTGLAVDLERIKAKLEA